MCAEQEHLLEEWFHSYYCRLTLYAESILRDRELGEELVQDTFHEAARHMDALAEHGNPGGWLMRTLQNKMKTYQRTRARNLRRFLSLDQGEAAEPAAPDNTEAQVLALDEEAPLAKIRRVLTEEEFRFLKRLVFDRAPHKQVAEEFHITVWASQKRLERIRKKLEGAFPERTVKK